jgi:hypothetical protein
MTSMSRIADCSIEAKETRAVRGDAETTWLSVFTALPPIFPGRPMARQMEEYRLGSISYPFA